MTTGAKEELFFHGNTQEDWARAHEKLTSEEIWRSLAFRGVMVDPVKGVVFVQLGCPACDTTLSKQADLFTAMEIVANACGICHRSLEALTASAYLRRPRIPDGEAVPEPVDDSVPVTGGRWPQRQMHESAQPQAREPKRTATEPDPNQKRT